MSDLKTKQNDSSVLEYINSIEIKERKDNCFELLELFGEISGEKAKIWGKDIVGFGTYTYKGKSGKVRALIAVAVQIFFKPKLQVLNQQNDN